MKGKTFDDIGFWELLEKLFPHPFFSFYSTRQKTFTALTKDSSIKFLPADKGAWRVGLNTLHPLLVRMSYCLLTWHNIDCLTCRKFTGIQQTHISICYLTPTIHINKLLEDFKTRLKCVDQFCVQRPEVQTSDKSVKSLWLHEFRFCKPCNNMCIGETAHNIKEGKYFRSVAQLHINVKGHYLKDKQVSILDRGGGNVTAIYEPCTYQPNGFCPIESCFFMMSNVYTAQISQHSTELMRPYIGEMSCLYELKA